MRVFYTIIFCINILVPSIANSHGLYLASKNGGLHAYFDDGSPASGAIIKVVDNDGIIILNDKMDNEGYWKFPSLYNNHGQADHDHSPELIIVEATGGHRSQITWEEALKRTPETDHYPLAMRLLLGVFILIGVVFIIKRFINIKRGSGGQGFKGSSE